MTHDIVSLGISNISNEMSKALSNSFSTRLLAWFDQHGRKTLPWQNPVNHYRVWISEIMLQQTQVITVIEYFNRFMQRFPNLESLAQAPLDAVMSAWAGLGYYTRARNIHKTAQIILSQYAGRFPQTLEELIQLPGIGRSTASAILSIVDQQPLAILDGNVKRVLSRYYKIQTWPGETKTQKQLWTLAAELVPKSRPHHYTQAIMDLGAIVCTPKRPDCLNCPLQTDCQAHQAQSAHLFPIKKPSKLQPERFAEFAIIIVNQEEILLHKQIQKGVWHELFVPPNTLFDTTLWNNWVIPELSFKHEAQILKPFTHIFTHFKLQVEPRLFLLPTLPPLLDFPLETVKLSKLHQFALPAPIQKLVKEILRKLQHDQNDLLQQAQTRATSTELSALSW